jgi:cell filamentation protein
VSSSRFRAEQAIFEKYLVSGTEVLKNKFGITNLEVLERAEAKAVLDAEPTRPKFKKFDLQEIKAVHKHMLGEVYDWAGTIRNYSTGRGAAPFAAQSHIRAGN